MLSLKKVKIALTVLMILTVAILASIGLINYWVMRGTESRIHTMLADVPESKVALVLGARVYKSGKLSAMLEDRVVSGVDLYKAGKVQKLIMSGDNRETNYDEVTAMRNRAIALGVPPDDAVRDFAGFRTYDSLYRMRELWDLRELVIVTQEFHLPRTLYIAENLGFSAQGYIADRRKYSTIRKSEIRECLARCIAWLDITFHTRPYFLGSKEGLSGIAQDEAQHENN